jgi:hypothetical protein
MEFKNIVDIYKEYIIQNIMGTVISHEREVLEGFILYVD